MLSEEVFTIAAADAKLPTIATAGSAGYDFYAMSAFVIPPGGSTVVDTGVRSHFGPDGVLFLKSRSGLAVRHGISTEAGVIDSDYRDNIKVLLRNSSDLPYEGNAGDRISQGVFLALASQYYPNTGLFPERDGGLGSTGR